MLAFYTVFMDEDDDRAKFEQVYTLYKKKMWYTANAVLSDGYLAEDAVHNAFVGIAKNINKVDDVNSSKTLSYVITAAKNAAIDLLRKNRSHTEINIDELYDLSDTNSSSFYQSFETENTVQEILLKMPSIYRDVLYLLLVEEMTEKEIASLLGRKPGTVHQQVRRGRKILQNELRKGVNSDGSK